jgi:hypothetical protein
MAMKLDNNNKRVAILYICTGLYRQFFQEFYRTSEEFFLREMEKHYFVWSDDSSIVEGLKNVTFIYKVWAGFPADSLFRFELFLQAEDELKKYDYVYFMNANSIFVKPVGEEILPDERGLAMGRWSTREHQHPMLYPYERNKKSLAYIEPYKPPYIYFSGALNGGTSQAYLQMSHTLSRNIRIDYENGIIAKFHDESHINAYLRTHKCKVLSASLIQPEEFAKSDAKIILREKTHIDPYFNKNRKFTTTARLKKACNIVWDIFRWYLKF